MPGRWESAVDKQIREAQERGDFDNLPGAGKPIADLDQPYDENWWVKGLLRRESESGPGPLLALRKEIEGLRERVCRLTLESSVREIVTDLNRRIRATAAAEHARLDTVDLDTVLAAWREHRAAQRRR
jgi:hypothetical protein